MQLVVKLVGLSLDTFGDDEDLTTGSEGSGHAGQPSSSTPEGSGDLDDAYYDDDTRDDDDTEVDDIFLDNDDEDDDDGFWWR